MAFKTINIYLFTRLSTLSFHALISLVSLDFLIDIASQSSGLIDEGLSAHYLYELLHKILEKTFVYFPFAVLVGSVLALGSMSAQLELETFFSLGYSYLRLLTYLMIFALSAAMMMMVINEIAISIAPGKNEEYSNVRDLRPFGNWFREGNLIINAGKISKNENGTTYRNARFFAINDKGKLVYLIAAESMLVGEQVYNFVNARVTHFDNAKLHVYAARKFTMPRTAITGVEMGAVDPRRLNTITLASYLEHLEASKMRTEVFELVFWERFATPLSIPVMLLLILLFLFHNLQKRYSLGGQLVGAIILGSSYWIVSQAFAYVSLIWDFPVVFGAFGPHLLCLAGVAAYVLFLRSKKLGKTSYSGAR